MEMFIGCFSPCIFSPATVPDRTLEPIALYVSFWDWLRRSGKRMSVAYEEKITPVLLSEMFLNAMAGMDILLNEASVLDE